MADAAKSAFDSVFSKTKEVLGAAAETTKAYAGQAQEAIGKIIPGAAGAAADPNAAPGAAGAPAADPTAAPMPPQ